MFSEGLRGGEKVMPGIKGGREGATEGGKGPYSESGNVSCDTSIGKSKQG